MLTATGVGSGLDIDGLVTQLIAAERSPTETRLLRQEASLTAELSAFGSFKGVLSSFQSSLSSLNSLSTFGQRSATSSDASILSVSASSEAAEGSYNLNVSQLATSHSLATSSYTATSDVVGTGTLTFRFGSTDYISPDPGPESYDGFAVNPERGVATITIDSSNNSLEGVRDAINDADIGIAAAIVNDGSGYRLLLSSEQTGEANSIEITVDDTGDADNFNNSGLSALAFNSGATNVEQTVAAQDATLSINGLSVSSSTNDITGVIDGVDIELKDVTGGSPVTVAVTENRDSVKEAITSFINGYNSFIQASNNLTAYDSESGASGALQGDFSARSITSQLRQVMTSAIAGFNGPFSSLSEIGVVSQADGTLAVDSDKLDSALENNFDVIVGMFAAVGFPSDENIEFIGSTAQTIVGSHAVNISQLATRGQLTAATATFPLTIDADNDSFTLSIDGVSSASISLTQGSYASGAELAAEIQARINGDSALVAAGVSVNVEYDVDHFEITSESYGSASKVEITAIDINSTADLGFSVVSGTDGLDVEGTIGGQAATGIGQTLTGAVGSLTEGLILQISGGATGDRGVADFSRGLAYQINTMISSFLKTDGVLDSRTDSIQGRIDNIDDQREVLDRRIEALEARYLNQFNALDSLLAQLQSTSDFLTQQLASLPEAGTLLKSN